MFCCFSYRLKVILLTADVNVMNVCTAAYEYLPDSEECSVSTMSSMHEATEEAMTEPTCEDIGVLDSTDGHQLTELICVDLEIPAQKHVPASWTFAQMSKLDEERLDEFEGERAPSPKTGIEVDIAYQLERSSVKAVHSHAGVSTDYQSEGEEDDLFLEVAEPSVLPRPTDACELARVTVSDRQWMLALLQRVFYESELAQSHEVEAKCESATAEEVPRLFGLAAKALPTPTRAVLQDAAYVLQMVEEKPPTPKVTQILTSYLSQKLTFYCNSPVVQLCSGIDIQDAYAVRTPCQQNTLSAETNSSGYWRSYQEKR